MINDLWLNLPVKDISKSKEFFSQLGFTLNNVHGNSNNSACLLVGKKNIVVMLFDEQTFKGFSNIDSNIQTGEVLLSIGVDTKDEVDELAAKAVAAGGTSNHKPKEMQGSMYGCLFTDLDGHRWNVLYMNISSMNQ